MAAAAAAVVDLYGQLLRLKAQAKQSAWQSQLETVLQQQQTKLQAWAEAQVCFDRRLPVRWNSIM